MIEVDGLRKSFGTVEALRGVTFTVPDGAITGLLGPNGAGKTTTLRILTTILRPDGGSARVDGQDSVETPEASFSELSERIGVSRARVQRAFERLESVAGSGGTDGDL